VAGLWNSKLFTAAPTVTELYLAPARLTVGVPSSATLKLQSTTCFTAQAVTVAVRDKSGENLGFHGATNVAICPSGYTLTTGARSFTAGTYTIFGTYEVGGTWSNLPSTTMVVGSAPPTATPAPTPTATPTPAPTPTPGLTASPAPTPTAPPTAGKTLAWSDDFGGPLSASTWNNSTTSSYEYGNHNLKDNKLDWTDPSAVSLADGTANFTAQPSSRVLDNGSTAWSTGLLTTEGTASGFQVRTGDYLEARVQLPTGTGAWPALWTWKDGNNEIDTFEYHPDNPNLLEFSNHVHAASTYYTNATAMTPGRWVTIGTLYGANSVQWYVNGAMVYQDDTGVGTSWSAYVIISLSVSAGRYHPAPPGSTPITFAADYVRAYH
jgi:beta-glucanase (GH16 family)